MIENEPAPSAQERLLLGYTKADEAARTNQAQVPGKWARRLARDATAPFCPRTLPAGSPPAKSWRMEMPPEHEEAG